MEFDYIVGWYLFADGKEVIKAGFTSLEAAKKYCEGAWIDFFTRGCLYIDTPEGRYIYGDKTRGVEKKWYAPGERTYVYDSAKDEVINIDEVTYFFGGSKMHVVIKGTKTVDEYKELHAKLSALASEAFESHKESFGEWKEGEIAKVWIDSKSNLCIEYESGNWWHYNGKGEWW